MLVSKVSIMDFFKFLFFLSLHIQHPSDHPGVHIDFAKKRLQLAESLYFKTLESITLDEKKRAQAKEKKPDLTVRIIFI